MTDPRDELRAAFGFEERGPEAAAAHPSLDEIAAYHARTLPADEDARLQDHLVACRDCADLLLEREEFARAMSEAAGAAERSGATEPAEAAAPTEAPAPLPFVRPARRSSPARGWQAALAASLLAVVGLSLWSASLRRTVEELSRPEINAPIRDLAPAPRRGEGEPAELALAPGTRFFSLVLGPAGEESFDDWEVEIARGERVVWRGRGLRPNAYRSFSLTLARRLMSDGEYRIRLRGLGAKGGSGIAGGGTTVGEYRLRIVTRR